MFGGVGNRGIFDGVLGRVGGCGCGEIGCVWWGWGGELGCVYVVVCRLYLCVCGGAGVGGGRVCMALWRGYSDACVCGGGGGREGVEGFDWWWGSLSLTETPGGKNPISRKLVITKLLED